MRYFPKISFYFISLSMISTFVLSGDVLSLFGYNFALAGASFLYKLHPSFYLIILAFCSLFFYKGGASLFFETMLKKRNFFLLLACVFCMAYKALILKQPATPFIITWLYAVLVLCFFECFSTQQKRHIYNVLLVVITFNALMGVAEYVNGAKFVPASYFSMEEGGLIDVSEWGFQRAGALYGHPLIATLISATVVAGFYGKSLSVALTKPERICFWASVLSFPAFGGRTSIAVCFLIASFIAAVKLYRAFAGQHISHKKMIVFLIGLFAAPLVLSFMFELGLFDSVIDRLQDDNGSAGTRLSAFYILFDTPYFEIFAGDYNKQLFVRQLLFGTKYGIEIFWLAILLQFGAIVSAFMIYILFIIHKYLYDYIAKYTIWSSLVFLLGISSGTGLASKTLMLAHFLIISLFLLAPNQPLKKNVDFKCLVES